MRVAKSSSTDASPAPCYDLQEGVGENDMGCARIDACRLLDAVLILRRTVAPLTKEEAAF